MRKRYTLTMLLACLCLVFLTPLPALCADGAEMAETVPGADIVAVILTYLPASWGGLGNAGHLRVRGGGRVLAPTWR